MSGYELIYNNRISRENYDIIVSNIKYIISDENYQVSADEVLYLVKEFSEKTTYNLKVLILQNKELENLRYKYKGITFFLENLKRNIENIDIEYLPQYKIHDKIIEKVIFAYIYYKKKKIAFDKIMEEKIENELTKIYDQKKKEYENYTKIYKEQFFEKLVPFKYYLAGTDEYKNNISDILIYFKYINNAKTLNVHSIKDYIYPQEFNNILEIEGINRTISDEKNPIKISNLEAKKKIIEANIEGDKDKEALYKDLHKKTAYLKYITDINDPVTLIIVSLGLVGVVYAGYKIYIFSSSKNKKVSIF